MTELEIRIEAVLYEHNQEVLARTGHDPMIPEQTVASIIAAEFEQAGHTVTDRVRGLEGRQVVALQLSKYYAGNDYEPVFRLRQRPAK